MFTEPHSTKQIEDCVGWGLETDAGDARAHADGGAPAVRAAPRRFTRLCARVRVPGARRSTATDDAVRPLAAGAGSRELTGGALVALEGSGHCPHARDPVQVNLAAPRLRRTGSPPPRQRGLDADRDAAASARSTSPRRSGSATPGATSRSPASCAGCTPTSRSTGSPSTRSPRCSSAEGERIHPARRLLANESAHIESESGEHDLHCFQAIRRMDEILVANFMVFDDVVREEQLRPVDRRRGAGRSTTSCTRTPSDKRAAYAWLTDFVGWLPMPDGGEREAALTADYNAEMIEHIARFPRLRDRAIFVGNPDDIVAETFGPGLPAIREWTERPLRLRRLRDRLRPGATLGDRERAARASSATARTSRSASSRSAARASAARLLRARDRRLPAGASGRCPSCA